MYINGLSYFIGYAVLLHNATECIGKQNTSDGCYNRTTCSHGVQKFFNFRFCAVLQIYVLYRSILIHYSTNLCAEHENFVIATVSHMKRYYRNLIIDHYDKLWLFGYDLKKESSICSTDINVVERCIYFERNIKNILETRLN